MKRKLFRVKKKHFNESEIFVFDVSFGFFTFVSVLNLQENLKMKNLFKL